MNKLVSTLKGISLWIVPMLSCVQASAQITPAKLEAFNSDQESFTQAVAITNASGNLQWFKPTLTDSDQISSWSEVLAPETSTLESSTEPLIATQMPLISQTSLVISDPLINVNFCYNGQSGKTGLAAVGISANDYWNPFPNTADSTIGLKWYEGSASGVSMRVQNAPGSWGNSTGDSMFDSYIYNYPNSGNITITIQGLPQTPNWTYDIYIYGHGAADNQNGIYTLSGTTLATSQGAYWNNNQLASGNFIQGGHYVVFTKSGSAGGTAVITITPDAGGYPLINGMQIVFHAPQTYQAWATVVSDYRSPSTYSVGDGSATVSLIPQSSIDASTTILLAVETRDYPAGIIWFKPFWEYNGAGWAEYAGRYSPMKKFWTTLLAYQNDPDLLKNNYLDTPTSFSYFWVLSAKGVAGW